MVGGDRQLTFRRCCTHRALFHDRHFVGRLKIIADGFGDVVGWMLLSLCGVAVRLVLLSVSPVRTNSSVGFPRSVNSLWRTVSFTF